MLEGKKNQCSSEIVCNAYDIGFLNFLCQHRKNWPVLWGLDSGSDCVFSILCEAPSTPLWAGEILLLTTQITQCRQPASG